MKRKLLSISIVFMMFFGCISGHALASSDEDISSKNSDISLRYVSIYSASTSLSINSNGIAEANSYISAASNIDKIVISSYLQVYNSGWVTVKNWSKTVYSNSASMYNATSVSHGTYRLLTYFYAYDGSTVESTSQTATYSY